MSLYAKAGPRPTGLSLRDKLENCKYEEKQMTAMNLTLTGASSASDLTWETIRPAAKVGFKDEGKRLKFWQWALFFKL